MEKKTAIEIYEERKRIRLQRQKDRPAEQERIMKEWVEREEAREDKKAENKKEWKARRKEFGSKMRWNKETKAWGPATEAQSEPAPKPVAKPPVKPKTYAQQRRARMKARSLGLAPPIELPSPAFKNLRRPALKPPSTKPPSTKPKSEYAQRRARMKTRIFGAQYDQLKEIMMDQVYKKAQQVIIETANPTPPRRKYENEKMRNKARMNARLKELKDEQE